MLPLSTTRLEAPQLVLIILPGITLHKVGVLLFNLGYDPNAKVGLIAIWQSQYLKRLLSSVSMKCCTRADATLLDISCARVVNGLPVEKGSLQDPAFLTSSSSPHNRRQSCRIGCSSRSRCSTFQNAIMDAVIFRGSTQHRNPFTFLEGAQ